MEIKNKIFFCLLVSICLVVLSACTAMQRTSPQPGATPSPQGQNIIQTTPQGYRGDLLSVPQSPIAVQSPVPMSAERTRADNIRNQLGKMPELSNIHVVVMGNTALIGFTPSPASKDINTTRKMVSDRVKQVDTTISNVAASESGDMITKINQLSNDIANNKVTNDLSSRFNNLVRSIAPTPAIR